MWQSLKLVVFQDLNQKNIPTKSDGVGCSFLVTFSKVKWILEIKNTYRFASAKTHGFNRGMIANK
jgi:hypothetical protein